jgi:signal transduction histidine kinase
MRNAFLDKLLGRIDRVQPEDLQQYLVRLAQDKQLLETIFNALQEGVIVTDGSGNISYANPAACSIFGLDPEASTGRPLAQQVSGLDWESLVESERIVSRDLEIFYPENRFVNFYILPLVLDQEQQQKSGSTADDHDASPFITPSSNTAETGSRDTTQSAKSNKRRERKEHKNTQRLRRLAQEDAPLAGYAVIVRDITEERRSTQQVIESEQMGALTMLAAGVAHEIGNPLNSLHIHLQLMERKIRKLPESQRQSMEEMIDISKGEVNRLHFIVTQFLRAIRPTSPSLEISDINELLEESLSFLSEEVRNRDIDVNLNLRDDLPQLPVDRDQLKQAFYNLVRNSSQAMKGGGHLHIESDMDDFHLKISFTDTGGGITAEDMSKIFNPFFTTKSTGTGLGLLIVRRIVREHGGEIEIESNEGQGTTVRILLPLVNRKVRLLTAGDTSNSEPKAETEDAPTPPEEDLDAGKR